MTSTGLTGEPNRWRTFRLGLVPGALAVPGNAEGATVYPASAAIAAPGSDSADPAPPGSVTATAQRGSLRVWKADTTVELTRAQLLALSDAEVLARYREKHGDPFMPLSMATKLRFVEVKYLHLRAAATRRARESREAQQRRLSDLVNDAARQQPR